VSGQKSNASVTTPPLIRQITLRVTFGYFQNLKKSALKRTHFVSVEAGKTKSTEVPKALQEKDFQRGFDRWKIRMDRRIEREVEYTEGEKCQIVKNR